MAGCFYRELNVLVKMYAAFAPSPQSRILHLDPPRCLPFRRRRGFCLEGRGVSATPTRRDTTRLRHRGWF